MPRKFTVTLPDGTVAKRSSQNADYQFAVVVHPADPEKFATNLERLATEADALAAKLTKAADEQKFTKRDRGPYSKDYNGFDFALKGTEVSGHRVTYPLVTTRGNDVGLAEVSEGEAQRLGLDYKIEKAPEFSTQWVVVDARSYLLADARARAAANTENAAEYRAQAAAIRSGDLSSIPAREREYAVVRWSRTRDLAAKAADGEFAGYSLTRKVEVVPVDAA